MEFIMSDKIVKVGIVGCGGMGRSHIHYILEAGGFEITTLCDLSEENLDLAEKMLIEKNLPKPKRFTDYNKMLEAKNCEALSMSMPIPLNAEFAWKGLEAGYHVLSEKPCAVTLKEAARLKKAVEKSGKVYQVGFEIRHSPLASTVKKYLDRGEIGNVCGVTFNYARKHDHSYRKWAFTGDAGSVLFDCLSHSFDLINLFSGSQIEKIAAFTSKESQLVKDTPDIGSIALKYQNGVHATVFFCEFCGQKYNQFLQIFGDNGKMLINPADAGEFTMYWGEGKHEATVSINPESTCPGHLGIGEEHVEFRNAIIEKRQAFSDFQVGLNSLFLSIGSTRSAKEERFVTIEELKEEFDKEYTKL
jgi:myo-inositol 2-dehydrogenase/D-chiro-inositol 1-dehydrogenase